MNVNENERARVVIEAIRPEIDAGRFPIKRAVGEVVVVEANAFADGHDAVRCTLLFRKEGVRKWSETSMESLGNDRWRGEFRVTELGRYLYSVQAWVDRFATWRQDMAKKIASETDVDIDYLIGAALLEEATDRVSGSDAEGCKAWARNLRDSSLGLDRKRQLVASEEAGSVVARHPDRRDMVTYDRELSVIVDPEQARFSSWYELFPRSFAPNGTGHGSFRDCEAVLNYVASMGFDVLYLPPIHPIGRTHRKGKNNSVVCTPEDVGSPWAIGAEEGGHKSVHPQLGTIEEFRWLVKTAESYGIRTALDIAFQCSPDHPYLKQHTEWFRKRPDGSIQYAENPPKKYQDIYPFDFECEHWSELWKELKSIFLFWIEQGVRIFRVDNPHTKPFRFWERIISEIKRDYPETIFLSEAFTRPRVMYRLAKIGFTQSYTYFTWRNTKQELVNYFTELTKGDVREFFRPNLWPNTPDILPEYLQFGGRPAFIARLVLAATLGANYGIYGPAFELCERTAREPGGEEYLDSEKYELKNWNRTHPDSLRELIARVNNIRKANPALRHDWNLQFHPIANDQLICYSKRTKDQSNVILVVVNLDPHHTQSGWIELAPQDIGAPADRPYQVHDLLSDAHYLWQGQRNYVELNPHIMPAHIFRVRRWVRTERQFDYYM